MGNGTDKPSNSSGMEVPMSYGVDGNNVRFDRSNFPGGGFNAVVQSCGGGQERIVVTGPGVRNVSNAFNAGDVSVKSQKADKIHFVVTFNFKGRSVRDGNDLFP